MSYVTPLRTILSAILLSFALPAQTPLLSVRGDIAAPLTLTSTDLTNMPREIALITEKDGTKASYEGVRLRDILKRAGVPLDKDLRGKLLASYLLARGSDSYEVVFSIGEVDASMGNEAIVVADKRDGKPLPDKVGPLRLVCTDDKVGARSVRMLDTLEFLRLKK